MGIQYGINSDIKSKNKVTDRVYNVVEKNQEKNQEINKRIKILEEKLKVIEKETKDVRIRLNSLGRITKVIAEEYFIEGTKARIIANKVYKDLNDGYPCSESNIEKIAARALDQMAKI